MNLLDRIRPLQLMILAAGIFFSCESETNTFDFDLENNTAVELVELVLPTRSIFIDSLRTDNESTIVAGRYADARFGDIEAEGYTQIKYDDGRIISDTLKYDSLIINLTIENFVSNDPNAEVALDLFGIREDLEASVVYLKNKKGVTGFRLDTMRFNLQYSVDSLKQNIRVRADRLGDYIYSQLIDDDIDVETDGYTGDVGFVSKADNQTALTINLDSDSSELLLYTSFDTIVYETRLVFQDLHYSYVSNDFSGSQLEGITDREIFDLGTNEQFISPIFGIFNFVDFAPLQSFIESYGKVLINRAEIKTPYLTSIKEEVRNTRYYFHDSTYGIRGEGIFTNGYETAILSNEAYINESVQILIGSKVEGELYYSQDLTFFIENYYNYYLTQGDFLTDGIVITPNRWVTLQESELFSPSSTTIKIYVTSIN